MSQHGSSEQILTKLNSMIQEIHNIESQRKGFTTFYLNFDIWKKCPLNFQVQI